LRWGEECSSTIEEISLKALGRSRSRIGIRMNCCEVPIAVVKLAPGQELNLPEVREKIIREIGSAFAIEKSYQ